MSSKPLILAFDTSAAHCAAALLSGDQILAHRSEDMARGQGERLIPFLEEILAEAGSNWAALTAIGVGIGPGNFTGIRISVSAARGLALALDIPAVGVSTFQASLLGQPDDAAALVPAPRDQVYFARPGQMPAMIAATEAKASGLVLHLPPPPARLAVNIARIALRDYATTTTAPAPLYVRAADAAPSRDAPPLILPDDA